MNEIKKLRLYSSYIVLVRAKFLLRLITVAGDYTLGLMLGGMKIKLFIF